MAKALRDHENHKELLAFGLAVRRFRIAQGLSQETLAAEAGLDRSYMGGIERGEHNVALLNQLKIARALGLKLSEIYKSAKL